MSKATWVRPPGPEEQAFLFQRYEQLAQVWRTQWPEEPIPELSGDTLRQTRTIQLMAHRLRGAGVVRPAGGLRRGPGMEVEDATLRRVREAQQRGDLIPNVARNGDAPPPGETKP